MTDIETEATQEIETKDSGGRAEIIIRNHIIGSLGVGLIPLPLVDMVALTGVQLNMLRRLAKVYEVPFSRDLAKSIIASLIGGGIPVTFTRTLMSLMKGVPLIGLTVGALAMPILSGATTYAVGKVFVQHFASGGTFLNFNPEEVREYFNKMFKEGQEVVAKLKKGKAKSTA
jgi:uncharacterized protein (DUF697 family)